MIHNLALDEDPDFKGDEYSYDEERSDGAIYEGVSEKSADAENLQGDLFDDNEPLDVAYVDDNFGSGDGGALV